VRRATHPAEKAAETGNPCIAWLVAFLLCLLGFFPLCCTIAGVSPAHRTPAHFLRHCMALPGLHEIERTDPWFLLAGWRSVFTGVRTLAHGGGFRPTALSSAVAESMLGSMLGPACSALCSSARSDRSLKMEIPLVLLSFKKRRQLQAADHPTEDQLRQVIATEEELFMAYDFATPSAHHVDFSKTVSSRVFPVHVFVMRLPAEGGFFRQGPAANPVNDPLEHAHIFAETGPQKLPVGILAEPIDQKNAGRFADRALHFDPVAKIVAHMIAAEREHRHGIAADLA
jgi:hypothetical protein